MRDGVKLLGLMMLMDRMRPAAKTSSSFPFIDGFAVEGMIAWREAPHYADVPSVIVSESVGRRNKRIVSFRDGVNIAKTLIMSNT